MRASAAILIFAAWPCFIQSQNSRVTRVTSPKFADTGENIIREGVACVKNLGLTKCIGAFGSWRAASALNDNERQEKMYREKFPWQVYGNISNEELYEGLCDATEKLLQQRPLKMTFNQDYSLQLGVTGNRSLNVDIMKSDEKTSGRSSMKKLQKHFYNIMPFLLMPGLIMSAILPFILPSLKMMTLAVGMLNNMALTGAVFTLLRNNAFNDKYEKKVIYLNDGYANDGYLNEKYEPLADTPSQVLVDPDFTKQYSGIETHEFKDYNSIGNEHLNAEYQVSSDWLRQITNGNVKDVKITPEKFNLNDWRKQDTAQGVEVTEVNKIVNL